MQDDAGGIVGVGDEQLFELLLATALRVEPEGLEAVVRARVTRHVGLDAAGGCMLVALTGAAQLQLHTRRLRLGPHRGLGDVVGALPYDVIRANSLEMLTTCVVWCVAVTGDPQRALARARRSLCADGLSSRYLWAPAPRVGVRLYSNVQAIPNRAPAGTAR